MSRDALLDAWQEAWSSRDPDAFRAVCTPDVHYEDPVLDQPIESVGELGRHAQRLWDAFPDARMEATAQRLWSPDGRYGCAPVKLLATHKEELAGLPATGRFLVLHAVFYVELDEPGERVWRVRGFFDRYDAAVQLGVLPARGTMGERALLMLRGFGWTKGR
ncbi:ester cyclase [Conexibacter sp. W3-3-2]|uniref:ester cyclase n=1 Tax=Conexibacter sp. W3-3-2 TaxID=2675227 RepID=UPI0018AC0493|nr:ester cyclase [Conexibacter sp. W3-3-2]